MENEIKLEWRKEDNKIIGYFKKIIFVICNLDTSEVKFDFIDMCGFGYLSGGNKNEISDSNKRIFEKYFQEMIIRLGFMSKFSLK